MTNNSSKESPNSPKHKRIKIVEEQSINKLPSEDNNSGDGIKIKKEDEQDKISEQQLVHQQRLSIIGPKYVDDNGKFLYNQSNAYTTSARDKSNILIATKDPESIRSGMKEINTEPKAHDKHQPREPTDEEVKRSLELWRALLRSTNDYGPDKNKTSDKHLIDLKFLMGARSNFNKSGMNNPIERLQFKHEVYGSLQRQYYIPDVYMAPDAYFEVVNNPGTDDVVYFKRCCSVLEYYVMLSEDNPQYKPFKPKASKRPNPRDYRPLRNVAHNPFISSDKAPSDTWGKGLMSLPHGSAHTNAWKSQTGLMGDTTTPPVINSTPEINSTPLINRTPVINKTPVLSKFSEEQQEAAEKTHRHRTNTDRSNIPIPQSDDSSQDEDDSLFDDKLLPADKNRIMRLRTEIKRIKGGTVYPTGYENDRRHAIKQADELRVAGKQVPAYLEGDMMKMKSLRERQGF
jgi:hypothetical protein